MKTGNDPWKCLCRSVNAYHANHCWNCGALRAHSEHWSQDFRRDFWKTKAGYRTNMGINLGVCACAFSLMLWGGIMLIKALSHLHFH